MAFSAIWIAVASLLAVFDIKKATDENGNIIEPTYEYISGLVTCVFTCSACFVLPPHAFLLN